METEEDLVLNGSVEEDTVLYKPHAEDKVGSLHRQKAIRRKTLSRPGGEKSTKEEDENPENLGGKRRKSNDMERRTKQTIDDILEQVLASDSEFEGFSDGDDDSDGWPDDDPTYEPAQDEDGNNGEAAQDEDEDAGDNDDDDDVGWSSSDDQSLAAVAGARKKAKKGNKKQKETYNFEERRTFVPPTDTAFKPVPITPDPVQDQTPYEYFKNFVTDEMLQNVVTETNKYSVEKDGQSLDLTLSELEIYIGIYFYMGLVKMPALTSYWEKDTRYPAIADEMGLRRFKKLAAKLHFVDNNKVSEKDKEDRVWKLRPWIRDMRANFRVLSCEEHQSIDEIMVAFKGHNLLRQYMQKKPKKWGFKLWGRCGASGICHDFEVYQGKGTGIDEELAPGCGLGGSVVLQLCEGLPRGHQFKIFADNYFTNFAMAVEIRDRDIGQYLGTIQKKRIHNAPLKTEKQMENLPRGSISSVYDKDRQLVLVRWIDNKCVTLLSTYLGVEPTDKVRRYNKSTKAHIEVNRPSLVRVYNVNMGGVDLLDMMCSLYKKLIRSNRWYLYIFYHTLTMAMVNAWFHYRRDCKLLKVNKKTMPLKKCQSEAAEALVKKGKVARVGRPSLAALQIQSPPLKRKRSVATPIHDVRFDSVDHWPVFKESRTRCRHCSLYTSVNCTKCKVALCMVKERNCFLTFHVKQ